MSFTLTAQTLAPLALSIRHATGNDLDTLTYIPGSTLRGALACAWLEAHGNPKAPPERFRQIFLSENVRVGNLCIDGAVPAPFSARVCVRSPEDHPIVDHLLQSATGGRIGEQCNCGAKRRRLRGFLFRDPEEGFLEKSTETRRMAHTAIHPRLLRAANEQFHSARVINENQFFIGALRVADGFAEEILTLIQGTPELYLGRGRTRGQGLVRLSAAENPSPAMGVDQIQEFHSGASRRFPGLGESLFFSCTFVSPCILLDDWLMSKVRPDGYDIEPALADFRVVGSFNGTGLISGWNSAAGVPKSEVHAISAGSTYLFAREGSPRGADFVELASALNRTAESGIGERVAEGFGEAVFCHALHTEYAENAEAS